MSRKKLVENTFPVASQNPQLIPGSFAERVHPTNQAWYHFFMAHGVPGVPQKCWKPLAPLACTPKSQDSYKVGPPSTIAVRWCV